MEIKTYTTKKEVMRLLYRQTEIQKRIVRWGKVNWLLRLLNAVIAVCDPDTYEAVAKMGAIV